MIFQTVLYPSAEMFVPKQSNQKNVIALKYCQKALKHKHNSELKYFKLWVKKVIILRDKVKKLVFLKIKNWSGSGSSSRSACISSNLKTCTKSYEQTRNKRKSSADKKWFPPFKEI